MDLLVYESNRCIITQCKIFLFKGLVILVTLYFGNIGKTASREV